GFVCDLQAADRDPSYVRDSISNRGAERGCKANCVPKRDRRHNFRTRARTDSDGELPGPKKMTLPRSPTSKPHALAAQSRNSEDRSGRVIGRFYRAADDR